MIGSGFSAIHASRNYTLIITHREKSDFDCDAANCFQWRPQRDSNSCYRRERAMS